MVEEFACEGEVVVSNPGRCKVCKNCENAATIEWVCGCRWGPPRIKKNAIFALFYDFWKLICRGGSISSHPYKSIQIGDLHSLIGAAAKTDATDHLELPLQMQSGVARISPINKGRRKTAPPLLMEGSLEVERSFLLTFNHYKRCGIL